MSDLEDFDLGAADPSAKPPDDEPRFPVAMISAFLVLVIVIATVAYLVLRKPAAETVAVPSTSVPSEATPGPGGSPAPLEPPGNLPALAESDGFVREQAAGLSAHPQLAVWLASRGLVRVFATAVVNLADGRSPAALVPFLTPKAKFFGIERGGRQIADERSFAQYDELANGVASLDTAGVARVYRTCLPLLNAAYAELGYPNADFSLTMERAIAGLLATPVLEGDVALKKDPLFYRYADPELEALSLAQKQLLRTGPRNARLLQGKLRDLYRELGFTPHA